MGPLTSDDTAPAGPTPEVDAALTAAFAEEWGRVAATLIRVTGDWTLAEDCAQEAFLAAARRWPHDGVPRRPGAWLTTTARNAAVDRLRRAGTEARKLQEVAVMQGLDRLGPAHPEGADDDAQASGIPDDRLRLIFTCCHPALPLEARVALTLRTLCGLSVAEIARAFGAQEAAMSKRLVRARQKIAHAGIPYRVPAPEQLDERLDGVLAVIYLLFTEGYTASAGPDLVREPLSREAIRLARTLAVLVPGDTEVLGLLALMLLHDARRAGRVDASGALMPLEEQDRTAWDADRISDGVEVLLAARRSGVPPGPYRLQAEIAAQHTAAPTAGATDWGTIAVLYDELATVAPSPYVDLGRAVAVAMAHGPDVGLELIARVRADGGLAQSHYLPATEADLQRRAGRRVEASVAYRAALALVGNEAERAYLERRLAELGTA